MENKIDKFIEYLKNQKIVNKNLYKYCWLSGCQTEVHPITVWEQSKRIVLQWNSDRKIFDKFIERVKAENPGFITAGIFRKSDGSCPSTITFWYE